MASSTEREESAAVDDEGVNPSSSSSSLASERLNLFDEVDSCMDASTAAYTLASIRQLARRGELNENEKILELPIESLELKRLIMENMDALEAKLDRVDVAFLREMMEKEESKKKEQEGFRREINFTFHEFDDEKQDQECVYMISVVHDRKLIHVSFRGSMTVSDWVHDAQVEFATIPNPVVSTPSMKQDASLKVHRGFKEYLYGSDRRLPKWASSVKTNRDSAKGGGDDSKNQPRNHHGESQTGDNDDESNTTEGKKVHTILQKVHELHRQYPNFLICCNGHSLGGALATLFAFEAACDAKLPKPITCVTVASPKVGDMRFRRAVHSLETQKKLRIIRVSNHGDVVTVLPDASSLDCLQIICRPDDNYRHVGLKLKLFPDKVEMSHARVSDGRSRFRLDQLRHLKHCAHFLIGLPILCCCSCKAGKDFSTNHGVQEYSARIKRHRSQLERTTMNELYNQELKKKLYDTASE